MTIVTQYSNVKSCTEQVRAFRKGERRKKGGKEGEIEKEKVFCIRNISVFKICLCI